MPLSKTIRPPTLRLPSGGIGRRAFETKAALLPQTRKCAIVTEPWGPVLPVAAHQRCRVVRQLTAEMVMLVGERVPVRRDRRRTSCHVRQISMYICHVVLQISMTEIGQSFGRDRTTVSHACHVVEDRRDDPAFDDFVASVERVIVSVFGAAGGREHA